LGNEFRVARKIENKIMATRMYTTHNYKYGSVASPSLPQPTRLKPEKTVGKRGKRDFLQLL